MPVDTTNFKVSEFACKCCGKNNILQPVIDMCQKIRYELNMPVNINSGYRCQKQNAKVGGAKSSRHMQGRAADISIAGCALTLLLAVHKLFLEGKLSELGYCIYYPNKNFVHVDLDIRPSGKIFEVSL